MSWRLEFHRARALGLMEGAVVALLPSGSVMALATLVPTSASSMSASPISTETPELVSVDQHSATVGKVSKTSKPLPAGPTEMAASALMAKQLRIVVRGRRSLFMVRFVCHRAGHEHRAVQPSR